MPAPNPFARINLFVGDTLGGGATLLHEDPPAPATLVPVGELGWSESVRRGFGFDAAYSHQAETYRLLEEGKNVIITTPTASGKTGAFFPALFGGLEQRPEATALLVYPLVALGQDQREKLDAFAAAGGFGWGIGEFQGSANPAEAFAEGVRMVTATPDKLHWNLTHPRVREFLGQLRYLVLDEAHSYRGGFGSEVAGLLRRLLTLARALGARPQVVMSTATIGNPAQFARELVGVDAALVSHSGAARHGKRYYLADHGGQPRRFWDAVVRASVERDLKVLAFFRSRRRAQQLYHTYRRSAQFESHVHLYMSGASGRAGRLSDFRAARSGVMFATNALEAGVDIGDLEVVILDGYPGSRMAFRQMAGRSGRVAAGAVLYLPALASSGIPLPVDAFYSNAANFEALLTGPVERAVVEAGNPYQAPRHQARLWAELRACGLRPPPEMGAGPPPQHWLLRGDNIQTHAVVDSKDWERRGIEAMRDPLESPSLHYALTEKHEGALFSLDGRDYKVTAWEETPRGTAIIAAEQAGTGQETRGLTQVRVRPVAGNIDDWTSLGPLAYRVGEVTVTREYRGYQVLRTLFERVCVGCDREPGPFERICAGCGGRIQDRLQDQLMAEHLYEQPITLEPLHTVALEVAVNEKMTDQPAAAAHTLKHALMKLIPEAVACDAGDLAGAFRESRDNAFYLYDDWRGGLGIARRAADAMPELLQRALELTEQDCCTKPEGCYECVAVSRCHAPTLPSGEWRPLSKGAARDLLAQVPSLRPARPTAHAAGASASRTVPPTQGQIGKHAVGRQEIGRHAAASFVRFQPAPDTLPDLPPDWPKQARELLDLHGLSLPEVSARLGVPSREIRAAAASVGPLTVTHPKWGDGHLTGGTGTGERREVLVYFPGKGQKRLLLKFAGLTVK